MSPENRRKRAKKRLFVRKTKRLSKASALTATRLVLFAVMVLLLLLCVAWIFFVRAFNAQHISEVITQTLQQKLNRPVMISSLHLKYLNTIELKGFYVLDTYGEPGKPFLAADSVTLAFDILPLLDGQLVIREVSLNAPRFNLVRSKEGLYNVPRVEMKKKGPSTYISGTGRKFTVSVEDWRIKEGVFSFKDLVSGAAHALYGVNAKFENLRFDDLSRFELSMMLRNQWQEKISEIEIDATGHINLADFNWREFALRSVKTQVYLFKTPIELELDADNMVEPH
ncbi:MAG: AsmA family protein, partial [Elusimicrobiaceae bacterium]|nr:AsmA family protein [Elusimicrobiaceae bacterium]